MKPFATAASIVLIGCASVFAGDWPQWRGPDRTGHVPPGAAVPSALPAAMKVVWKAEVGAGLSSPVVSAGKVFHLDNQEGRETLHALKAATGEKIWSVAIEETFKDAQSMPGPRCSPVVDGERVYAQSCRGELKCLAVADGKLVWRTNYQKDFGANFTGEKGTTIGASRHGYTGAPLVDGERIYATVGASEASLVCFNKLTGAVIWKTPGDIAGYAAPVMASLAGVKQIIYFTAESVMGVEAAGGKMLWRVPVKTGMGRHVVTPIVFEDLVVVSSYQVGLMGIKISKDGDGLKAERAWLSKEAAINFASPVAVGQHLYGVGMQRNLECVDLRTGQRTWSKDGVFTGVGADKAYAGMIVMGGNILTLLESGELVLMAADPKEFRAVGRVQACGKNWCNPAYADGKLYLRDGKEMRCVEMMP